MKVKNIAAVLLAVVFIFVFSGCTGTNPSSTSNPTTAELKFENVDFSAVNINADDLVSHMNGKLKFDDKLYAMDGDIAETLYKVTGLCEKISVVGSTGSTAECIVFIVSSNESDAQTAAGKLRTYCSDMSRVYESYNVVEAEKLSKAFIMQNGKYTVMCVSPDSSAAESVYKEYVVSLVK